MRIKNRILLCISILEKTTNEKNFDNALEELRNLYKQNPQLFTEGIVNTINKYKKSKMGKFYTLKLIKEKQKEKENEYQESIHKEGKTFYRVNKGGIVEKVSK